MEKIHELFNKEHIVVSEQIARRLGNDCAILFADILAVYDGDFTPYPAKDAETRTGIPYQRQLRAINKLKENGFIEVKKCGLPAVRYVNIIKEVIVFYNNI